MATPCQKQRETETGPGDARETRSHMPCLSRTFPLPPAEKGLKPCWQKCMTTLDGPHPIHRPHYPRSSVCNAGLAGDYDVKGTERFKPHPSTQSSTPPHTFCLIAPSFLSFGPAFLKTIWYDTYFGLLRGRRLSPSFFSIVTLSYTPCLLALIRHNLVYW